MAKMVRQAMQEYLDRVDSKALASLVGRSGLLDV